VKARLVRANHQWGMKNPPLMEVSLYTMKKEPLTQSDNGNVIYVYFCQKKKRKTFVYIYTIKS
ncbi:hypothetical protein V7166_16350, partial [Bacillus thuringiensis]